MSIYLLIYIKIGSTSILEKRTRWEKHVLRKGMNSKRTYETSSGKGSMKGEHENAGGGSNETNFDGKCQNETVLYVVSF